MKLMKVAFAAAVLCSGYALADDGESKTLLKNAYQQSGSNNTCVSQGGCYIQLPPTTASSTVITNVSCSWFAVDGTIMQDAYLTNQPADVGPATPATFYLQPFIYAYSQDGGGIIYFGLNGTTHLYFKKGDVPLLSVGTGSSPGSASIPVARNFQCTVSGYQSQS
jgi:hypothetical protein